MGHVRQYKHSNDRKAAACIANITLVSFPYLIHAGFRSGTETKITPSQLSAITQLNCPHPPLHSTSFWNKRGRRAVHSWWRKVKALLHNDCPVQQLLFKDCLAAVTKCLPKSVSLCQRTWLYFCVINKTPLAVHPLLGTCLAFYKRWTPR